VSCLSEPTLGVGDIPRSGREDETMPPGPGPPTPTPDLGPTVPSTDMGETDLGIMLKF
jgi:hypothetical protein